MPRLRSEAVAQSAVPRLMRAVLLRGHGGFEQLEYRDGVPVPLPLPGEVLIRIGAAAVNNTDINTRIGWYSKSTADAAQAGDAGWRGGPVSFPRIQGADACGLIVAVGAGVAAARIGERVLVDPVLRDEAGGAAGAGYFGADRDGAFADFATVPAENACPIDSDLSDAELASFPCSYAAAENMLTRAEVGAGETVLVTGASGGVGSAAVQLARRRGARVLAVASAAKAELVRSLGASQVLARAADLRSELGPESLDAVIDVVGGTHFPAFLDVLRRGGRYAVAGAVGGPLVELDLRTLYLKDLRLLGCTMFAAEIFHRLVGYIERREIRPLVSASYALRDIVAAQQAFLTRSHAGKIVLTLTPGAPP